MLAKCSRDLGTSMEQCVIPQLSSMSATLNEIDVDSGETVVDRQHKAGGKACGGAIQRVRSARCQSGEYSSW